MHACPQWRYLPQFRIFMGYPPQTPFFERTCVWVSTMPRKSHNYLIPLFFSLHVGGPFEVHSGTRALGMESALVMYGFISITGESLKASSPFTVKVHSSTFTSSTTHKHIGLGLDGLLQAKTPVSTFLLCLLGKTNKTLLSFLVSR